jgi:hypothetical protein
MDINEEVLRLEVRVTALELEGTRRDLNAKVHAEVVEERDNAEEARDKLRDALRTTLEINEELSNALHERDTND